MVRDLQAFLEKASNDEALMNRVSAAKSTEDLIAIASDSGFEFSEDDLMDVSGGVGDVVTQTGDIGFLDFSKFNQDFKQIFNTSGSNNTVQASAQVNFGSKC